MLIDPAALAALEMSAVVDSLTAVLAAATEASTCPDDAPHSFVSQAAASLAGAWASAKALHFDDAELAAGAKGVLHGWAVHLTSTPLAHTFGKHRALGSQRCNEQHSMCVAYVVMLPIPHPIHCCSAWCELRWCFPRWPPPVCQLGRLKITA